MKVWIDQDLCTGDGLCEEIAPSVFTLLDDGLAYVKEGDKVFSDPGGADGLADVPAGMEEATIESAEECPGECIFIESTDRHRGVPPDATVPHDLGRRVVDFGLFREAVAGVGQMPLTCPRARGRAPRRARRGSARRPWSGG